MATEIGRSKLDRDGYVVVERALTQAERERLEAAVDRVWRAESPDGGPLHRLAFLGLDDAFIELVDHAATLPLVVAALGWNIFCYHCHLDVHPPLARMEPPAWRWHQDGGRQNVDLEPPRPRLSVKVAYFLTDVTAAADGALLVIPGSHVADALERPGKGMQPPGAAPVLVPAGSAVVFDRRLWHARGDNRSQRTRKALFYGFTYRWIRPRDEFELAQADLERLDPVRRQLLGAGNGPLGHWFPTDEDAPLRLRA